MCEHAISGWSQEARDIVAINRLHTQIYPIDLVKCLLFVYPAPPNPKPSKGEEEKIIATQGRLRVQYKQSNKKQEQRSCKIMLLENAEHNVSMEAM